MLRLCSNRGTRVPADSSLGGGGRSTVRIGEVVRGRVRAIVEKI